MIRSVRGFPRGNSICGKRREHAREAYVAVSCVGMTSSVTPSALYCGFFQPSCHVALTGVIGADDLGRVAVKPAGEVPQVPRAIADVGFRVVELVERVARAVLLVLVGDPFGGIGHELHQPRASSRLSARGSKLDSQRMTAETSAGSRLCSAAYSVMRSP